MERQERIRLLGARKSSEGRGHPVLIRGRYEEFPVTSVPQAALVYRFDNGRLAAAIEEHAASARTTVDALRRSAETAPMQTLLHDLLLAKANSPDGPIFAELERLGQQTEPLLILFDGTVLNGNRRLASMRALLARGAPRYAGFAEPIVAILPEATGPAEIEYVEAALQMAPETKLSYGWLDRRLKLRKQSEELRLPPEEIRAAYRIDDSGEVARELAELSLAESYLADHRGEPLRYSLIADAEDLFAGLREQMSQLRAEDAAFWRLAGFAMIDGRPRGDAAEGGRRDRKRGDKSTNALARFFPFAAPVPSDLPVLAQARIARACGIAIDDAEPQGRLHGEPLRATLALFQDRSRSGATAKSIADTLDEMRLEHGERSAPERMLTKVREAGQIIARMQPDRLSPQQRRDLQVELATLSAHASYILGALDERPHVPARWNYPKTILRPPYWKVPWRLMRRMGWATPMAGARNAGGPSGTDRARSK